MEEERKQTQRDTHIDMVIGFLSLEAIALTCFGFAGTNGLIFLRAIGFCLSLFLFPFAQRIILGQKGDKKAFLPLIPVGVTLLLLCFSLFWFTLYSSSIFTALFDGLLVFLGIGGFFLLGVGLKNMPKMKLEYILLAFLGGLALTVFITMLYSLIRYGFFYATRYAGMVYYYDGVVFKIANEGKFLDGFKFREVSLNFAKWGGFVLASSGAGLFANSFKANRRNFLILAGFALLGIIDMAVVPFREGLLLLLPVYIVGALIAFLIRLKRRNEKAKNLLDKIVPILYYVLMGLVIVALLALFIDCYLGHDKSFLAQIPLLGKLFQQGKPGYLVEDMISNTLFPMTARGRTFSLSTALFGTNNATRAFDLPFFEFNVIWQNGTLAFIGVLYCIFFFMKRIRVYLLNEEHGELDKKLVVAMMILGMFLYFSFLSDELPLRHPEGLQEPFSSHSTILLAFPRSNAFIMLFFLLGLAYVPAKQKPKEVPVNE